MRGVCWKSIATLEQAGVRVWLDGGWGIDALVGEQTREHDDLDCVIALSDAEIARDALAVLGFAVTLDELTHPIRSPRPN